MTKAKIKRSILARVIPGLTSLVKKGPSGWMVILGMIIVTAMVVMTVIGPWIAPYDPAETVVGPIMEPPSPQFPMGTTRLGQDMLSRILCGGSIMLQVSALS